MCFSIYTLYARHDFRIYVKRSLSQGVNGEAFRMNKNGCL